MDRETPEKNSTLREVARWGLIFLVCATEWGLYYKSIFQ
jgi:hypothetical protein